MADKQDDDRVHASEIDVIGGVFLLYARFDDLLAVLSSEYNLSRAERSIIVNLRQPRRLGWLAQELNVVPSVITLSADTLVEKGLACRVRGDDDRRVIWLKLSTSGEKVLREFEDQARSTVRQATGLGEAEIGDLSVLLRRVVKNTEVDRH